MAIEIKIQTRKGKVFSICIGHDSNWFSQMGYITITEEFYINHQIVFAILMFSSDNKIKWIKQKWNNFKLFIRKLILINP